MEYKGFKIAAQYRGYEVWETDEQGRRVNILNVYDNEFDGFIIWDGYNGEQHDDFQEVYDTPAEARAAIDQHLANVAV